MDITRFHAKKILNSKGEPAIQVSFHEHIASAPAGTSTGRHAVNPFKVDIDQAIHKINNNKYELHIDYFKDLKDIEREFGYLGANPVIAMQMCALKALSDEKIYDYLTTNPRLPRPLGNCIGGGKHSVGLGPDFQEFLVVAPQAQTFFDAAKANSEVYNTIRDLLGRYDPKFDHRVTLEGAWKTQISNLEALDIITKAAKLSEKKLDTPIKIGLDIAASSFYKDGNYHYKNFSLDKKERTFSPRDQLSFIDYIISKYKLYYVEDPFEEEDFESFKLLNHNKALICGDDLTVSSPHLIENAVMNKSINSIIIKPNQIGSINKTIQVINIAKRHNIIPVMSHRSGETSDTWLSHLAVGFDTPLIKCGIYGPERSAKINELLRIEREIFMA